MRIIIDSNIFVSCMNYQSDSYIIFRKLVEGAYTLYITTDIALEYLEVFQRKFSEAKSEYLYRYLSESAFVKMTPIYFKWNLITIDADDNKFVDCAIASGANYIVTNDTHFNILKKIDFPKVKCISLDEFIEILLFKT